MAHIYNSQLDAYTLYHQSHESSASAIGPALPALGHAMAGSFGTAISNLSIYPLDLIITRLQVQRSISSASSTSSLPAASHAQYDGVLDAAIKIYEREGLAGFYTGVVQDTGKSIADSFLFFLFYNYLRSSRLKKHGANATTLPVLDELVVGMLGGAASKFFTTPIANVVTRKQTSSMFAKEGSAEPTVADIIDKIREEKGLQGFWSGYSASLVLTLNPSITFFLYEFFKRTMLPRARRDDPGARVTFLMAAVSKAIASTITYPFSLAKARAQSSSKPPVDPASARDVKSEVDVAHNKIDAKKAGENAKNVAKRSTVFNTILDIYHKEGAGALYEGVLGEILKGFFSHGITMLVKERIHKLIIQTYFLILKALNKYPSPSEALKQAGDRVTDAKDVVGAKMGMAANVVAEKATDAGQAVKLGYTNASESMSKSYQTGKDAISVAAERAGVVSSNTVETAKNANDYASKEAGHLLGNAQEMLGDKLVDVGNEIKPKDEN